MTDKKLRTVSCVCAYGVLGGGGVRPPLPVLLEIVISLALCIWGALRVPGTFLPVLPDAKENRVVTLHANLDFMVFNHRGRVFPPKLEVQF
ncbi:hypothetical protein R1flu_014712 [Riccia fluitans]|uniref:Uncharacterized protein n=1 Tax=Riccia fluitans TaxID=41844 RepID=A0ABD1YGV9_9MARC